MSKPYPKTIYTLLSMLSMKPMSGYDIKRALKHMVNHFWSESDGQIYPGLKKCIDEGLATSKTSQNLNQHALKKTYQITPEGRSVLSEWLNDSVYKSTQRDEGLLKLTFCDKHHQPCAEQLLQCRLQKAQESLTHLENTMDTLVNSYATLPNFAIVKSHQLYMLEAEIAWANEALANLRGH